MKPSPWVDGLFCGLVLGITIGFLAAVPLLVRHWAPNNAWRINAPDGMTIKIPCLEAFK